MNLPSIGQRFAVITVFLLLSLVSACADARKGELELLDTPVPGNSQTPNLVAQGGRLYLSWVEESGDGDGLRFASFDGKAWSAPQTIAESPRMFVNWADFASLLPLENGTLAAQWLQRRSREGFAYDARLSISRDGGATWDEGLRIHDDDTESQHGFVTLMGRGPDTLGIVWLDGRETTVPGGTMRLMYREWNTGGLGPETLLDSDVCTCCQTDALVGPSGIIVTYRDHHAEEIRDISTVRLAGGAWGEPTGVHRDGWKIAGCPVNGPAIDGHADAIGVAWFTAADDDPRVLLTRSVAGQPFGSPIRIDEGAPVGRVALVAMEDGSIVVGWIEGRSTTETDRGGALLRNAEIRLRRLRPDGVLDDSRTIDVTAAGRASGFPRLARVDSTVYVAWTETGESPRVRLASLEF